MPLTANGPSQELVDIVGMLGGTWSGHVAMCRCPAHADSDAGLSVRQGDRGILVTYFAGCSREDVLRELRRVRPSKHYELLTPLALRGLQTSKDFGIRPSTCGKRLLSATWRSAASGHPLSPTLPICCL